MEQLRTEPCDTHNKQQQVSAAGRLRKRVLTSAAKILLVHSESPRRVDSSLPRCHTADAIYATAAHAAAVAASHSPRTARKLQLDYEGQKQPPTTEECAHLAVGGGEPPPP